MLFGGEGRTAKGAPPPAPRPEGHGREILDPKRIALDIPDVEARLLQRRRRAGVQLDPEEVVHVRDGDLRDLALRFELLQDAREGSQDLVGLLEERVEG